MREVTGGGGVQVSRLPLNTPASRTPELPWVNSKEQHNTVTTTMANNKSHTQGTQGIGSSTQDTEHETREAGETRRQETGDRRER